MKAAAAGLDLRSASGRALARAIRGGVITSTALVDHSLCRLESVGRNLNAVAAIRTSARAEAAEVDRAIREGRAPAEEAAPFFGVPCSVKEGLKVAGSPWHMGSRLNLQRVATKDGSVVARLKRSGAIITGLGAMAEMALWPETLNTISGVANHPHDRTRTPGGSSGGDAVLAATGCVPFALGTDGGGSVRIPAAYCGLFGHKPSAGLVPLTGHVPLEGDADSEMAQNLARFFAPGPICRHGEDLWPLLKIMAGPDGYHQGLVPMALPETAAFDPVGRTVLVLSRPDIMFCDPISQEQGAAVDSAATRLARLGGIVKTVSASLLREAFLIWVATLRVASELRFHTLLGGGKRPRFGREVLRRIVGAPVHTGPLTLLAMLDRLIPMPLLMAKRYHARGVELAEWLTAELGDDGILLLPPAPGGAPHHGHARRHFFNIAPVALFNALGLPSTVVPLSFDANGLPLGVQIVSALGNDHLTIGAALAIAETCPTS